MEIMSLIEAENQLTEKAESSESNEPLPQTLTVVTALFDLSCYDSGRPKSIVTLMEHAKQGTLKLEENLVIFTEAELADELMAFRKSLGLGEKTRIIIKSHDFIEEFLILMQNKLNQNLEFPGPNQAKDTLAYRILQTRKSDMLVEVAESNPFATDYLAWCDIGLAHVVKTNFVMPRPFRPAVNFILVIYQELALVKENFFRHHEVYRPLGLRSDECAGGFCLGSVPNMLKFHRECLQLRNELMASDQLGVGNDQRLFIYVARQHLEDGLAEFYFGDYCHLLSDYHVMQQIGHVLEGIIQPVKNFDSFLYFQAVKYYLTSSLQLGRPVPGTTWLTGFYFFLDVLLYARRYQPNFLTTALYFLCQAVRNCAVTRQAFTLYYEHIVSQVEEFEVEAKYQASADEQEFLRQPKMMELFGRLFS